MDKVVEPVTFTIGRHRSITFGRNAITLNMDFISNLPYERGNSDSLHRFSVALRQNLQQFVSEYRDTLPLEIQAMDNLKEAIEQYHDGKVVTVPDHIKTEQQFFDWLKQSTTSDNDE